jgi:hypothetical protein
MDKSQVSATIVGEFFVKKGIFTEVETAIKQMFKASG